MPANPPRVDVLVVEDDESLLGLLAEAIQGEGCTVQTCANGRDALRTAPAHRPDVILLDWHLADMNGGEFARLYREAADDPAPLILVTGLGEPEAATAAAEIRAAAVLPKPFELDDLFAALRSFTDCLN